MSEIVKRRERKQAQAAAAHLAKATRVHLPPTDTGTGLRAMLGVAIVGAGLVAGALQPALAGERAPLPAQKTAAAAKAASGSLGALSIDAPATREMASQIVRGIKASLYRELPDAARMIEVMDVYGSTPRDEARRIAQSLGVGNKKDAASRLVDLSDWVDKSAAGAALVHSRTGRDAPRGRRMADPVCIIGLKDLVENFGAPTVGDVAVVVLHEIGHCLQVRAFGESIGLSTTPGISASEVLEGAEGEAHVEAFAHVMIGENGGGTRKMRIDIAASDSAVINNDFEAAVGYRFAPMLEAIAERYEQAPASGFDPWKLTGFADAFAKARQHSNSFTQDKMRLSVEYDLQSASLRIKDLLADLHGGDTDAVTADMQGWRSAQAEAHPFFMSTIAGLEAYHGYTAGHGPDLSYRGRLRDMPEEETVARSISATRKWLGEQASDKAVLHSAEILSATVEVYSKLPGSAGRSYDYAEGSYRVSGW